MSHSQNDIRTYKQQRVQAGSSMTRSSLWTMNEPPNIKKHVILVGGRTLRLPRS